MFTNLKSPITWTFFNLIAMRNFYVSLLVIIMLGCNQKKEINFKNNFILKIYDSLSINLPNAKFSDFKDDKLLFYNSSSFEVIICDLNGRTLAKFNNFGFDDVSYGRIMKGNIFFKNDSIIAISNTNSIKLYNFKGEFKEKVNVSNSSEISSINNFTFLNDSTLIYLTIPEGNTSDKNYYLNKRDILTYENLSDNTNISFSEFPNEQSDIFNEDFYYPYIYEHHVKVLKNKGLVSYLNSNGSKLYYYDMNNNFVLKETFDLDLEHYNRLKINFGTRIDKDESIAQAFCSAIIKGNFYSNDTIYTIYKRGFSRDFIRKYAEENTEFPYYSRPKPQFYLNIIVNKNKKINDISFNKNQGQPVFVKNNGLILSKKYSNEYEDRTGTTTFYKIKLKKR